MADELDALWRAAARSGTYIGGASVDQFEEAFANYINVGECVAVGNGLDALRIALQSCGVGKGDEVIVPAQTFSATWSAVVQAGARPVPVDVLPTTNNINPDAIESAITPRTAAVIPVHLHGQPADMQTILRIAESRSLYVVEDAAQSHGASTPLGMTGALGHAAAFSFYPTKNLGAMGDAGAITTNDTAIAMRARRLRSYGTDAGRPQVSLEIGWNSRLDPVQARLLTHFLSRLDSWNEKRQYVARRYKAALEQTRAIRPIDPKQTNKASVWHHFIVLSDQRNLVREVLRTNGIETGIHYPIPVFRMPAFTSFLDRSNGVRFPVASAIAERTLSMPIHPWLGDDVETVVDVLERLDGLVTDHTNRLDVTQRNDPATLNGRRATERRWQ